MMTKKQWALHHAANGRYVFPLEKNGKQPLERGWRMNSTRLTAEIEELWTKTPDANIGIDTSRAFNVDTYEKGAFIAVDVDMKKGKDGEATLTKLEMEGCDFPETFEQETPTKGRHIVYFVEQPVTQGANVLGVGLDIRSHGGYIVGAGSTIDGRPYICEDRPIVDAPGWLMARLTVARERTRNEHVDTSAIDPDRAYQRCADYLEFATLPAEGERNDTAYKTCAMLKDYGATEDMANELMTEWNETLDAPMEDKEIDLVVWSCYKSGQNAVGQRAPEALFKPVNKIALPGGAQHPFDTLNQEYALVMAGGGHHILHETVDEKGKFLLGHLNEQSFHKMLSWFTMRVGEKQQPVSKLWLLSKDHCRRYRGLTFRPGEEVPEDFYNMWRGFTVKPYGDNDKPSLSAQRGFEMFIQHCLENACSKNVEQFRYMMAWFAHLIQRPNEKPQVAMVFKGGKGIGKNALIQVIVNMLGNHAFITSNRRYLNSNFNGHFESNLLAVFDEAFWSGDKESEGILKDLVTGEKHQIERKGQETFSVPNLTRVVIMSNEGWVVPASDDERRYFLPDFGAGWKQNRAKFKMMIDGIRAGGDRLLFKYLMDFDLSTIDINLAPSTRGLIDQKHASLEPFAQFWFDCISRGELLGSSIVGWPTQITTSTFRNSFQQYARARHIRSRLPDEVSIIRDLAKFAPSFRRVITTDKKIEMHTYFNPGLAAMRAEWERWIGSKLTWEI